MKLLFDHNVDRRFRRHLPGHEIETAREMGWEKLANGVLLRSAADAGFDALLSIDKKLQHEQNLDTLPLAIVVLDTVSNALPAILPFAPFLFKLLDAALTRRLYIIQRDGQVITLGNPPAV